MTTRVYHPFVSAKSDGGDATLVRPSNWNADHTIEGALSAGFVGARAYNSGAQTVANNTGALVLFDSEDFDTDGFHSTSSNTSRFTVPSGLGGKYLLHAHGYWNSSFTVDTGVVICVFKKNGTTEIKGRKRWTCKGNEEIGPENTVIVDLAAGEYVEWLVVHSNGGDRDLGGGSQYETYFEIAKLDAGRVGSGVGASAYLNGTASRTSGTFTAIGLDTEDFDTDGFHDNSTNNSRMTIPAGMGGKYLIVGHGYLSLGGSVAGAANVAAWRILKNGDIARGVYEANLVASTEVQNEVSAILDLAPTDYVELVVGQNTGSTATLGYPSTDWTFARLAIMRIDSKTVGSGPILLLDYDLSTDITNQAITAGTFFDIIANQTFTKQFSGSLIQVVVKGMGFYNDALANFYLTRINIDSAGTPILKYLDGAANPDSTLNRRGNVLAGGSVFVSGLATGAHTIKVQTTASSTNDHFYCRASGLPPTTAEFLNVQVVEHP